MTKFCELICVRFERNKSWDCVSHTYTRMNVDPYLQAFIKRSTRNIQRQGLQTLHGLDHIFTQIVT